MADLARSADRPLCAKNGSLPGLPTCPGSFIPFFAASFVLGISARSGSDSSDIQWVTLFRVGHFLLRVGQSLDKQGFSTMGEQGNMSAIWIRAEREMTGRTCWFESRYIAAVDELEDGKFRLTCVGNGGNAIATRDEVARLMPRNMPPAETPLWQRDGTPVGAGERL